MNLRCPVCRAENSTGPACRRCRADLSLLLSVEARREHHLAAARSAVAAGRLDDALEDLARADELRPGPDVCRVRACANLLAGDYAAALADYTAAAGA
jgi:hypothetical protein